MAAPMVDPKGNTEDNKKSKNHDGFVKREINNDNSTVPDSYTDPFAPREGKKLLWRNVQMTLKGRSANEPDRKLLDGLWGEVPKEETTAIMGPSGSGKSSLLNILSGRQRSHGRIMVEADIRINNVVVDPKRIEIRKHIAFVAQDDSLRATATPREAIRFSAKLRLSRNLSEYDIDRLTEQLLHELGLESCADTFVGGALVKGISGGERKRTAVAVELVVKPELIFLDEPTSGLDSFSAVKLCHVLKKVATAGASVLFTIHQPSSEIFSSFDRLILLNQGRVMYQGSVQDVPSYFSSRGYPSPENYNPADWIMQVSQSVGLKELDEAGFFPTDSRNFGDTSDSELDVGAGGALHQRSDDAPPPGTLTQIGELFTREVINVKRDKASLGARFGLTNFVGLMSGLIFFQVGDADLSNPIYLQSHFGAIVLLLFMSMFGTALPSLLSFPEERPLFLREYSTNHYSAAAYFLSKLTMEAYVTAAQILNALIIMYFMMGLTGNFGIFYACMYSLAMLSTALGVLIGCLAPIPDLAAEMLPMIFVPQMLLSGFFVVPELIPDWLRWAQYLCPLTYAVRIVLVNEFENCSDDPKEQAMCNKLLNSIDAVPDQTWWNWLLLVVLFVVFRVAALLALRGKASKYY